MLKSSFLDGRVRKIDAALVGWTYASSSCLPATKATQRGRQTELKRNERTGDKLRLMLEEIRDVIRRDATVASNLLVLMPG